MARSRRIQHMTNVPVSKVADEGRRERILVVGTRYIGDTVLMIPFLRNLRCASPQAVIDFHAEGAARHMLAACPFIDSFIIRRRVTDGSGTLRRTLGGMAAEALAFRRAGYTRAYLLKSAPSAAMLALLAAIPHRVGFARGPNRVLLSRTVPVRAGRHQADLYLDLLRADGLAVDDGHNDNWTVPVAAARVESLLGAVPAGRPIVFLSPCATNARRNWPSERWARTLDWLVGERGCEVVLAGSPPDAPVHAAILAGMSPALDGHVHDFSTALSLPEAAALIARVDLCVGIDTGLPHLATSFGVPTVRLFGGSDPVRWGIWRGAGEIVHAPAGGGRDPMRGIEVGAVCDAVDRVLEECLRRPRDVRDGHPAGGATADAGLASAGAA